MSDRASFDPNVSVIQQPWTFSELKKNCSKKKKENERKNA